MAQGMATDASLPALQRLINEFKDSFDGSMTNDATSLCHHCMETISRMPNTKSLVDEFTEVNLAVAERLGGNWKVRIGQTKDSPLYVNEATGFETVKRPDSLNASSLGLESPGLDHAVKNVKHSGRKSPTSNSQVSFTMRVIPEQCIAWHECAQMYENVYSGLAPVAKAVDSLQEKGNHRSGAICTAITEMAMDYIESLGKLLNDPKLEAIYRSPTEHCREAVASIQVILRSVLAHTEKKEYIDTRPN